ncbi:ACS family glucarate transporter-like MFS transporter [Lysinibacillus composti]|uniref:MFS transporter n=1 Tax=Lysinibacillus composti TaxID=720633 RepID=A0A3N9UEU5_9BACI|nr:MFS transporter [Lysinibacillus composti]MBM7608449.1 ACS family glucarate transporter-like MFS transporter [Lysinibacillus composti]RQW74744.1 MFS transporter [Lysinibacillus composti]
MKTRLRWGVVLLLYLATSINYMDRAVLGIAGPQMMEDLSLTTVQFGLLGSAFFWTYTLMQIPVGPIVDKFGAKVTYAIAIVWWSLCTIATAGGRSLGLLLGIRAMMGIGESPAFPTNTRVIKDWLPSKERGIANGIFTMGIATGAGLSTPLLAWIIGSWGWHMAFILTGAVGLIWVPIWLYYYKNNPADSKMNEAELQHIQEGKIEQTVVSESKVKWYELLKIKNVWCCMYGLFSQNYLLYMMLTWLPTYLVMERDMSLLKAGFNAVIPWVVASIGAICGGLISDRLVKRGWRPIAARRTVMSIGMLFCLAIIPAGFVSNVGLALALISLSIGGMMFANSGTWAILTDIAPEGTVGTLAGLQNFIGNIAGWIAPIMTGFIVGYFKSFVGGLVIAGIITGIAFLVYTFLLKENEKTVTINENNEVVSP